MPNRSSSQKQNGCSICSLSAFSTCAICTLLLRFLPMFTRHCVCSFLLCSLCSAKLNFSHVFSLSLSLLSLCLSHSPTICFLVLSIYMFSVVPLSLSSLVPYISARYLCARSFGLFKWCYFLFWWLFAGRRSILRLLVLASWFRHIFLGGCLVVFVFFFLSLSLLLYIYIWRRPRFLPTFLPFGRQKQQSLAILRRKRGKGRNKKDDQIWSCFFWSKSALFPQFQAYFWLKGRQKTRPWPYIYIYIYISLFLCLCCACFFLRAPPKALKN